LCSLKFDASSLSQYTYVDSMRHEKSEGLDMEDICTPNRRVDFPSPQTTNPWSTMPLEKLIVPHLVYKYPTCYGTLSFIIAFTSALSQISTVSLLPTYFFKIRYNTVLPFTSSSLMRYLFLRFRLHNSVCAFPRPHNCHLPPPSHPSF
jgi:hypothetical protein